MQSVRPLTSAPNPAETGFNVSSCDEKYSLGRIPRPQARASNLQSIPDFIGQSGPTQYLMTEIQRMARFNVGQCLITGESGTGKELIARAIHEACRPSGPFIAVNCAAIAPDLADSAFFGHTRGAFTGATADHAGYFGLADGGTLFLDELGDMPLALQAKLLRVLDDGVVLPVGATTPRKTHCQIVAATNINLQERVTAGGFRADLYFRLARMRISTPPLRERKADIPLLARHFLSTFAQSVGVEAPAIAPDAMHMLIDYDYPGNVRELRNVMERALVNCAGEWIMPCDLQFEMMPAATARAAAVNTESRDPLPLRLQDAEQELMHRALAASKGNVAEAARIMGVHRSRFYRKLGHREVASEEKIV